MSYFFSSDDGTVEKCDRFDVNGIYFSILSVFLTSPVYASHGLRLSVATVEERERECNYCLQEVQTSNMIIIMKIICFYYHSRLMCISDKGTEAKAFWNDSKPFWNSGDFA